MNYGDEIEWRNKLARQGITFGARHAGAMPWETFQSDLVNDRVADEAGTTCSYLSALASGYGRPSKALAERLEAATGGQVLAIELRPAKVLAANTTE